MTTYSQAMPDLDGLGIDPAQAPMPEVPEPMGDDDEAA